MPDLFLLATRNSGKLREIRDLAGPEGFEVLSLADFPALAEVEETGETFAANALLKARAACRATGLITLADDSGLEVDALAGAPGVRSARFAGEMHCWQDRLSACGARRSRPQCGLDYAAKAAVSYLHCDRSNNAKLLDVLRETPAAECTARFRCVMAIVAPDGAERLVEGVAEGIIAAEPRGAGGFGYDPLFWVPEAGMMMAELSPAEKNRYSHRGKALRQALLVIKEYVNKGEKG
ncbi:MAG: RdgB/HAM1 family non-canonical purine NTP pyrophosphatase [Gracilibacteraceae bacterium]|jgi:XTP/dITP diphosphohydrolase|nr:RdgB/HAM1 family non-canonical purine NTP pyrophosphatase [Gracilibacteraceae bacterium]